jgi:hypothetical protein
MIVFACGGCGTEYSVESRLAGRRARCRSCGAAMDIPAPAPAAIPVVDNPLGLGMDWDSMGLPAAALAGPVLGSSNALRGYSGRRRKSGNGMLWLALGGAGLLAVLFIGVTVVAVTQLSWGGSMRSQAAGYLPANWTMAMSLQPARLVDRISRFPKAKPYIDQALAQATTEHVDVRDVSEVLIATEGNGKYFAAILDRPLDPTQTFQAATPSDAHQGLTIYAVNNPGRIEATYVVLPQPRLLVGANDLGRLKAMLDQVANRLPGAVGLPSGAHFAMRIRDVSTLSVMPAAALGPMNNVRGVSLTAHLSNDLSFDVTVDAQDAQTASSYEKMAAGGLEAVRMQQRKQPQNPAIKAMPSLPDNLRIYASGSQLRITGSLPAAQLFDNLPPPSALGAMPAFGPRPAAPTMPGGPMGTPR